MPRMTAPSTFHCGNRPSTSPNHSCAQMSGCESRKAGPPRRESLSLPPISHIQDLAAATRSPSGDERARSSSPRRGEARDGSRESTQCTLPSFQEVVRSVDRPQENSHLSPHWQRILNPTPPPRTYSIYRTSRATFTWPNLQLASQMEGRSIIYADYSTPPPDHYLGETSTHNGVYSHREFTPSPHAVQGLPERTLPKERVYTGVFCATTPFLNVERRRKEPSCKGTPSSIMAQAQSPVGFNSFLEDSDDDGDDVDSASEATPARASNWEDHTRICTNSNGEVQYECLWPLSYRAPGLCGYKRKKQLVKRHVESTHLNIRRFVCSYCDKGLKSQSTLSSHIWRKHTHEKPLECEFKCGEFFDDPARRHRHKEKVHQYKAKYPRKSKLDNSPE